MVLTAPATFIGSRASHAADGRLHFSDANGTLWAGSLRAHVDAPGGAFTVDRIAWRLAPGKLIEGRIAFDVEVDSREARGNVQLLRGWSYWEARGGAGRFEARVLPIFYPVVAAWRPEGSVSFSADGVRWNDREMLGPLSVEWRDAGVALSDVKPLGTYRLAVQGVGESAKLALSTIAGALRITGQGEAKVPRGVTFSGEAKGEGAASATLEPLLNLMGPRRPDGARSIEVRIR
jgi:general secretion pathway protein N